MRKILVIFSVSLILFSCGSIINNVLEKAGIFEERAYVQFKSSSTKHIAFIHMHHIGTELFYDDVSRVIDSLQKNSYVAFYEAIRNPEDMNSIQSEISERKLRKITGFIPSKYYDSISNKIAGNIKYKGDIELVNQPNYTDLNVDMQTAIKADVDIYTLIGEFESKNEEILLSDCDKNTAINDKNYKCELVDKKLRKNFLRKLF
ncbi:hypothetical protein MED134_09686 [Dokdonia sp. MED134]|uniref:hypothetical protein n=1 Tax=Dokdonia sp. MED134 TaxID=313590 RepID=UPI000068D0C6|nr:hypothetical protein [Dokdonia sp. MED134]EAQ39754.1 hypothetical protein MED134_09686 [Dokdonia sp. MED134]